MKRDWLQISSNLAIVVGLVIVVIELRQSHEIARSQIISDDYVSSREHLHALMGGDAASALAKAKSSPEELTEAERIVVDAHLSTLYSHLSAYEYVYETAVGFDEYWVDVVPVMFERDFDFAYARDWWLRERALGKWWSADLDMMLDEHFGVEAE